MHIVPGPPLGFTFVGHRPTNQDALYPPTGATSADDRLFVVCDGMGGADRGEVASQLLLDTVVSYLRAMDFPELNIVHAQAALSRAYDAYDAYLRQHPLVSRMGSTLAVVQIHNHGVTIAHIGDSRVYQVRDGRCIFRTKDHRQVADMVDAGIITPQQALTYPWRNRLSRAVMVSSDKAPSRPAPDLITLTDVRTGDYFFLCTDGVMEQVSDSMLESALASNVPDEAKLQALLAICGDATEDTHSGFLIPIRYVEQTVPVEQPV